MADVFVVNSGFRTRYPHVAVDTNRFTDHKRAVAERWLRQKL